MVGIAQNMHCMSWETEGLIIYNAMSIAILGCAVSTKSMFFISGFIALPIPACFTTVLSNHYISGDLGPVHGFQWRH